MSMNKMRDLYPHQKEYVDFCIKAGYDQTEMIVVMKRRQFGYKAILESDYLKMALRKRKLKQIQNKLIK